MMQALAEHLDELREAGKAHKPSPPSTLACRPEPMSHVSKCENENGSGKRGAWRRKTVKTVHNGG